MRKEKKRSEERKYFERLLTDRIVEENSHLSDAEWFDEFGGAPNRSQVSYMAQNWDEARALVDALEDSHLDDTYSPEKPYQLSHRRNISDRFRLTYVDIGQGDPEAPISYRKIRSEILVRLVEIAHLDFGDDPDEWRRWFKAFDEDDFFPPVR